MAILGTFNKQPNERLDFDIDFSEWVPAGDRIVSAMSTGDVGVTLDPVVINPTGLVVKQWVSGGTTGVTYKVQITATTQDGRIKEAEFKVKVKEV